MPDSHNDRIKPHSLYPHKGLTGATEGSLRWFRRLLLGGLFGKVTFTVKSGQIAKIDKYESIKPDERM